MSEPDYSDVKDVNVPHESEVAGAVDAHMRRTSDNAAIADPASPGASYVQAEVVALRTAIVAILDVLREAELIPTE